MYNSEGRLLDTPQVLAFGERLFDPEAVETTLDRAQNAILAWDQGVDSVDSPSKQSFSRNVVRLEVSAPELVDVTFIDLPGIVTNAKPVYSPHGLMTRNILTW
jgi:hypothetical protein